MARRQCTKENPYSPERDKAEPGCGWEHSSDAVHEVGDQEGDIVRMRCDNCGIEWKAKLPQ